MLLGIRVTSQRPRRSSPIPYSVELPHRPFRRDERAGGPIFHHRGGDLSEAVSVASTRPAAFLGGHVDWGIEVNPVEGFEQRRCGSVADEDA
jgi:hypothetical protein